MPHDGSCASLAGPGGAAGGALAVAGDERAEFVPGYMLALQRGVEPDAHLVGHLDSDAVLELHATATRYDLGRPVTFDEAEVAPAYLLGRPVTRGEVADVCARLQLDDPHKITADRAAVGSARQAASVLQAKTGIMPTAVYALVDIERAAADGLPGAQQALDELYRKNRERQRQRKRAEHTSTPVELLRHGVDVCALTPATPETLDESAMRAEDVLAADKLASLDRARQDVAERAAEGERARIESSMVRSVLDWKRRERPEAILGEDVLHRGTHAMLVGAPGRGKSTLAIGFAAAWALGLSMFLGLQVTGRGRVLYLAGEGAETLPDRFAAAALSLGFEGDPLVALDGHLRVLETAIDLSTDVHARIVRDVVAEFKPGLIVNDTFSQNRGGADENSATEMGRVLTNIDLIRRASADPALWLDLHHPTSASVSNRGSDPKPRGSTVLVGKVEAILTIRDAKGTGGEVRELVVSKNRFGLDGGPPIALFKMGTRAIPEDVLPRDRRGQLRREVEAVLVDPLDVDVDVEPSAADSRAAREAAMLPEPVLRAVCAAILGNRPASRSLGHGVADEVAAVAAEAVGAKVAKAAVQRQATALIEAGLLTVAKLADLNPAKRSAGQTGGEYLRPARSYPEFATMGAQPQMSREQWHKITAAAREHLDGADDTTATGERKTS